MPSTLPLRFGRITSLKRPQECFVLVKLFTEQETNGGLLAVVITISRPWLSTAQVGQTIASTIKNQFTQAEGDLYSRFERAVRAVNEMLGALAEQGHTEWIGHLDAALIVAQGDMIHVTTTGQAQVLLKRGHQVSAITDPPAEQPGSVHPLETFGSLISGQLASEDLVLISTADLEQYIDPQTLLTSLSFPVRLVIRQVARALRRLNVTQLGLIVIEASHPGAPSEDADLPDIVYLDQPLDTSLQSLQRYVLPVIRSGRKATQQLITIIVPKVYHRSQQSIRSTAQLLQPKAQRLLTRMLFLYHHRMYPKLAQWLVKLPLQYHPEQGPASSVVKAVIPWLTRCRQCLWNIDHWLEHAWLTLPEKRRRRLLLPIIAGFLILLVITNIIEVKQRQGGVAVQISQQEVLKVAKGALAQATTDSNNQALEAAQSQIAQGLIAIHQLNASEQNKEITELKQQLESLYDHITGSTRLTKPRQQLIIPGESTSITLFRSQLAALQKDGKELYLRPADANQGSQVILPPNALLRQFTARSEGLLLITNNANAVLELTSGDTPFADRLVTGGIKSDTPLVAASTFGSNLFILEQSGAIGRYVASEELFLERQEYLVNPSVRLKEAIDLAIDGAVYVVAKDGSVAKYLKGVPQTDFALQGLPKPLERLITPRSIFTDSDANSLYLLDAGDPKQAIPARVIELDKTGRFVAQFLLRTETPLDLIVSEKSRTLWVLAGSTIEEYAL